MNETTCGQAQAKHKASMAWPQILAVGSAKTSREGVGVSK